MEEIFKISLIAYMFCALGQKKMIFHWYQRLIKRLPDWLSFPLGRCYKCFTGQVCFWYFIFTKSWSGTNNDFIELAFFVSVGIFCAVIYNRIYCWLR
jgi:hypothetical protein